MKEKPITIVIISDYGVGDPSFTEVTLRIKTLIPNAYVIPHSTPAFSTLNTGFWIHQIALTPNLTNTYIFSNTAPRIESKSPQKDNDGEKLMYAKLTNGFEVIAINAGFGFSFIKHHISEFAFVKTKVNGSQFRSRDYFPESVAKMIGKDTSFIGEGADINLIPDFPKRVIASIDGYGNIKTTSTTADIDFNLGELVDITINNITYTALYSDGIFNVHDKQLVLALGSSGHDNKFMEIVVRSGSATALFENPHVETPFALTLRKKT